MCNGSVKVLSSSDYRAAKGIPSEPHSLIRRANPTIHIVQCKYMDVCMYLSTAKEGEERYLCCSEEGGGRGGGLLAKY